MTRPQRIRGGAARTSTKSQPSGRSVNGQTSGNGSPIAAVAQPAPTVTPHKANGKLLLAQPIDFWHKLGIFPEALAPLGRLQNLVNDARATLAGLGVGNLRLLCEQAKVPMPDGASDRTLAGLLLSESDPATLVHLREFLRRRTEAIETVYGQAFRGRQRTAFEAALKELSPKRPENLKPLTKLLLLYRSNPTHLGEVFAQTLWQSRPTSFEFECSNPLPTVAQRTILKHIAELTTAISKAIGGRGVQFTGSRKTCEGITVFTFFREYTPVVRPDFRAAYNVHHGCGLVLFGIDREQRRIFVKSGNRAVAHALGVFLKARFSVELSLRHDEVFSEYTTEALRDQVLGGYPAGKGIEIVSVSFARCGFGNHGGITLNQPFLQPSIRTELEFLRQNDLIEIHGPADISALTVTFGGRSIRVTSAVLDGGAVRFSYDNSGWDTASQDEFDRAFFQAMGVPLNRLLHPAKASLGSMGMYAYLLGIANEDQVQPYHEDSLHLLLERGIIVKQPIEARACTFNLCSERHSPVTDPTRVNCAKCDRELQDWKVNRLEGNPERIASVVANIFDDADDWKFNGQTSELDKQPYYELHRRRPDGREDTLCMLIADRPAQRSRRVFERTGLPLLFVQTQTDARHVYVDDDGIGHVSLSYLLSAQETEATRQDCKELCQSTLRRLLRNHEERLLKAARLSYDRLHDATAKLTGDDYEVDVFNLLRSLFPYSYKLAKKGNIEPDGYVCIPHYQSNSIEEVGSWNWSYDSKYSMRAKGYKFGIEEARKVVNYVKKLRRNRTAVFGEKQRPRGHVIISNNLAEGRIKRAAEFIFGPDGVGEQHREMRLLLMRGRFLHTLYERVRDNYEAIQRRRAFFGDEVVSLLQSAPVGGYKVLDGDDAEALIAKVLKQREIEQNIDPKVLAESLVE
ncbi:MAG: hypothetical protein U1A77_11140 [Pirellulales bacterium]